MTTSDLGKSLWLKAGYTAFGYYEPTLSGTSDGTYQLRDTIWSNAFDLYLGEITDTNQTDLDRNLNSTFVEFRAVNGELRYVRSDVSSFNQKFNIVTAKNSELNLPDTYLGSDSTKKLGSNVVLALWLAFLAIAGTIGFKIWKKFKSRKNTPKRK